MKYSFFVIIVFSFNFCSSTKKDENILGNDVRLFKESPAWEIAKAIEKEDTAQIKKLLNGKPNSLLNYREKRFGQSLLQWAVYTNHYLSAKMLSELGADPNLKSNDSTTAFIHAADKLETSEYLKLLLKYGGNVNAIADINQAEHLRTPLMAAAFKRFESVKILVNAGANANYVHTSHGGMQSALLYAFYGDKIEIVKYLIIEVGVNYKNALGFTIEGDSIYVVHHLRKLPFPLESEEYKIKMQVVSFLEEKGMDYWKTPVPSYYYKNYDSIYLSKY